MTHPRRAMALAAVSLVALPATAMAATRGVSVRDNVFSSKSVTIHKGQTIKWTWRGKAMHNVTVAKGPASFRSSTKTRGTFSHRFTRKGTYRLVCTVHAPGMKMTVTVR
jgi:plastocyanin